MYVKTQELEEELSTVVMERDGLQKSLKVLQEEYQSVAKEAKVFFPLSMSLLFLHIILPATMTVTGRWRGEVDSEFWRAS